MDPIDVRRIIVRVCRETGVELSRVVSRDRTAAVCAARRRCIIEAKAGGATNDTLAFVFGRVRGTIGEIVVRWRGDYQDAGRREDPE